MRHAAAIDLLNGLVTEAILRAEALPPGPAATAAFSEVSQLEEAIACLTEKDSLEGSIARRGAITAALSAGCPYRAMSLTEAYLAQDPPAHYYQGLAELHDKADSALRDLPASGTVLVRSVIDGTQT